MPGWFQTVDDLETGAEALRQRRFGVIEMAEGRLERIILRPWPKRASLVESRTWGRWLHERRPGDRCRLYYNQPWGSSDYLALQYVVSTRGCRLATFRGALAVLDEIARLKHSVALVCQASNLRISDRLLTRWGWQPHAGDVRARHFIKRFYGDYSSALPLESLAATSA